VMRLDAGAVKAYIDSLLPGELKSRIERLVADEESVANVN